MRFVIFCLFLGLSIARAQPGDAWARANEQYAAGHFREALEAYQDVAKSGEISAALFYNIANTEYRLANLGQAILNYERALALDPHQPEAEANLRLVRDKARALELQRASLEKYLGRVTPMQLAIGAVVAFWIAAFALTGVFLAPRRSPIRLAISFLAVLGLTAAVYGLYVLEMGASGRALAIVIAPKIEARLATADSAGTVLALPAGSEVKILSTRGDWSYAALPNDLRGWIPASSVERVRF